MDKITGRYDESLSPSARNARPFVNLRRPPASDEAEAGPPLDDAEPSPEGPS